MHDIQKIYEITNNIFKKVKSYILYERFIDLILYKKILIISNSILLFELAQMFQFCFWFIWFISLKERKISLSFNTCILFYTCVKTWYITSCHILLYSLVPYRKFMNFGTIYLKLPKHSILQVPWNLLLLCRETHFLYFICFTFPASISLSGDAFGKFLDR